VSGRGAVLLILLCCLISFAAALVIQSASDSATTPPAKQASTDFGKAQAATHPAGVTRHPIVPFIRPLSLGMKGCPCPAVFQMQLALKHAHFRDNRATGFYGKITAHQVANFQRKVKIKPASGRYGLRTHHALSKYYSQISINRLQQVAHTRRILVITTAMIKIAAHAWAERGIMRYSQSYTRSLLPAYPGVPRATDCSGYVTWVYHSAGRPDPSGFQYRVIGWTGTLAKHGVRVSANGALHVGDLVFYGGGFPYGHVAIVVDAFRRLVSSHGSPGIKVVPFNYRPVSAIRRYF